MTTRFVLMPFVAVLAGLLALPANGDPPAAEIIVDREYTDITRDGTGLVGQTQFKGLRLTHYDVRLMYSRYEDGNDPANFICLGAVEVTTDAFGIATANGLGGTPGASEYGWYCRIDYVRDGVTVGTADGYFVSAGP